MDVTAARDDEDNVYLYSKVELRPYTLVLMDRKKTVLFLPERLSNSVEDSIRQGRDLSPPEVNELKSRYGKDFTIRLGLFRAYKTDGRKHSKWDFKISSRAVLFNDSVRDLKEKADEGSLYIWTHTSDRNATMNMIRDVLQNKSTVSKGVIDDVLYKRTSLASSKFTGEEDEQRKTFFSPERAVDYVKETMKEKGLRILTSVGIRYALSSDESRTPNYACDPLSKVSNDDELDNVRLAPNTMLIDESSFTIGRYQPLNGEFFACGDSTLSPSKKSFYFANLQYNEAVTCNAEEATLLKLIVDPKAIINLVTIEDCFASDLVINNIENVTNRSVWADYKRLQVDNQTQIAMYCHDKIKISNLFWRRSSSEEQLQSVLRFKPPPSVSADPFYTTWTWGDDGIVVAKAFGKTSSITAYSGIRGLRHSSILETLENDACVLRASSTLFFVIDTRSPVKTLSDLASVVAKAKRSFLVTVKDRHTQRNEDDPVVFQASGVVVSVQAKSFPKFKVKLTMSHPMTVENWNICVKICMRLISYFFSSPEFSTRGCATAIESNEEPPQDLDLDDDSYLDDYFKNVVDDDVINLKQTIRNKEKNNIVDADEKDNTVLADLKAADPRLFDYPVIDADTVKYSTICQKNRQPIVVSTDEHSKFSPKVKALTIGSNPELERKNKYICPEVWCTKSRTPMSKEKFNANGCPVDGEKALIRSHSFVGYQNSNKSNEKQQCIPCCFSKPKDKTIFKCEREQEDNEDDDGNFSQYIMSKNSIIMKNKLGLLPDYLDRAFGNVPSKRGSRHDGTGVFTKSTSCFVRVGVDIQDQRQPFLSCMIDAIDHPKIKTIDDLLKTIIDKITPEIFLDLYDGLVSRTFMEMAKKDKTNDENIDRAKAKNFISKHASYAKAYGLNSSDVDAMTHLEVKREALLVDAFALFISYLQNDDVVKRPDMIGDLFNHPESASFLNPRMIRFVYIDNKDMSITTIREENHVSLIKFVLSSINADSYELIGHVSHKKASSYSAAEEDDNRSDKFKKTKNTLILEFEFEDIPKHLRDIIVSNINDIYAERAREKYAKIHKNNEFVEQIVISYDRAMVGFVSRSMEKKTIRYIPIDDPVRPPFVLLLGQNYAYEDKFDPDGLIDLAIYVTLYSSSEGSSASDNNNKKFYKKKSYDPEKLSIIDSIKNPLSPLPLEAKIALLCELIGCDREEASSLITPEDTAAQGDGIGNGKREFDGYYEFDMRVFKDENEILSAFIDPYDRIDGDTNLLPTPIPKVSSASDAVVVQRKNNAGIVGEYRQINYKWRNLLRGFEVLQADDTLWDIFERASTVLNRKSQLGGESLKAITSAFIVNDEEMLNHVALTNAAMETLEVSDIRKRILSGTCPPSFCEICVLSRLIDVRIVILRRKLNGEEDDDGFMCMNSNPNTDTIPNVIIFEHRIDKFKNVDIFRPIVYARRDIVNKIDRFSTPFATMMNERCNCKACWDERCVLVIEELAQKKKSHMDSLLKATIKKMYRKVSIMNRD